MQVWKCNMVVEWDGGQSQRQTQVWCSTGAWQWHLCWGSSSPTHHCISDCVFQRYLHTLLIIVLEQACPLTAFFGRSNFGLCVGISFSFFPLFVFFWMTFENAEGYTRWKSKVNPSFAFKLRRQVALLVLFCLVGFCASSSLNEFPFKTDEIMTLHLKKTYIFCQL